ncbi:hypothetical protein [Nostoc sp. 106C]|uniref:hypothetical protein n=1 Tax=Nostoc sp. 106C TaxID=1932667 RepID=UPI000A381C66|nr:hypothetical protein [Nostoc sp. 106C]OUL32140.1 hypothetical protein BV375_10850 [Nostoc sp. 106C]
MDFPVAFLVVVLFTIVFAINIAYLFWRNQQENKRSNTFKAMTTQIKATFLEDTNSIKLKLYNFKLLNAGMNSLVKNVLFLNFVDVKLYIFDYKYSALVGKGKDDYWQTVALFLDPNIRLPNFLLKPRGIMAQLGNFLGSQDIKFKAYPRFSEQYLLRGSNEDTIRLVFNDKILTFCEAKIGFYPPIKTTPSLEIADTGFIYYRENIRLQPEQIKSFMQEVIEVFDLFKARA